LIGTGILEYGLEPITVQYGAEVLAGCGRRNQLAVYKYGKAALGDGEHIGVPLVLCQAAAGFGIRALLHTDGSVIRLVRQQVKFVRGTINIEFIQIVPLGRIDKVKDMRISNGSVRHIGVKGDGNTAIDVGVGEHTVHIHPSGRNALYLFINGFICGSTGVGLLTVIKARRQSAVLHHHINTAHITLVLGGAVIRANMVAVAGHILPRIVRGKVPGNQVAVGGIAGLHSSLGRGRLTESL